MVTKIVCGAKLSPRVVSLLTPEDFQRLALRPQAAPYVTLEGAKSLLDQVNVIDRPAAVADIVDALDTVDVFASSGVCHVIAALGSQVLLHDISASVKTVDDANAIIREVRRERIPDLSPT